MISFLIPQDQGEQKNPKAFIYKSFAKAKRSQQRNLDRSYRREHGVLLNRESDLPAPHIVVVVGPPGVGKTTLIQGLVKHYTKQNIGAVKGPITAVTGKSRHLTCFECPNDLNAIVCRRQM
eukprot:g16560.t1